MLEKYPYEFPVINTNYDSHCALSLRFGILSFIIAVPKGFAAYGFSLTHMLQLRKISLYILRNI
jgi:hypothetical protein